MSFAEQLKLADIAEPEPVSQWPAIGWWLLTAIALVGVITLVYYSMKYWKKRQRLKRSLQALEQICQNYPASTPAADICGRLNILLKQHLAQAGVPHVLTLYGPAWQDFLRQHIAAKHHSDIAAFTAQLYQPDRQLFTDSRPPSAQLGNSKARDQAPTQHPSAAAYWPTRIGAWLRLLPC